MKFTFFLFAFFLSFFNPYFMRSEEIIKSSNKQVENTSHGKNTINNDSGLKKIHIVNVGDTLTSISKLYSINKELIIKLNNLRDEDYIYVGQNLKISETSQIPKNNKHQKIFHIVQKGDSLTEISVKYGLDLKYLIEINNLKDHDSIDVGSKVFLSDKNMINSKRSTLVKENDVNRLISEDNKIYGPLKILQNEFEKINDRKILNALNQNNKKLILSINCEKNELDVRIPGRTWMGAKPAKEEFEKDLINDFC